MLKNILALRISFFNILDNSSVTVLDFSFESESDSLQEPLFNEDDENETEQETISNRVSRAVEDWCKCDDVTKQPHITWMVMLEADPKSLLCLNLKSMQQMICSFQILAAFTKGSQTDVRIFEFQPLWGATTGLIWFYMFI